MAHQLKKELARLARALNDIRKKNDGLVPIDIFPTTLDIGGASAAIEIIVRTKDRRGMSFALKKRASGDHGWANMYHVIGTLVRKNDSVEKIFDRLSAELGLNRRTLVSRLNFFSSMLIFTRPRNASCLSTVYTLDITPKKFASLSGNWKLFRPAEISKGKIVDFHKELLAHANKKGQLVLPLDLT